MDQRPADVVRRRSTRVSRAAMRPNLQQALLAASKQPVWTYILSSTGTAAAPLALSVPGAAPAVNSTLAAAPLKPNTPTETWMLTADGYLITPDNPMLCVTADAQGNVFLSSMLPGTQGAFQQWTFDAQGRFVLQPPTNQPQVLAVGPNGSIQAPIVLDLSGPPPSAQAWSMYPGNPLNAILLMDPVPFPTWAPGTDLGNAYAAIMTRLGGTADFDLRGQYQNLAAPLGAWLSTILSMQCPNGVTAADWLTVQQQLVQELTAVTSVQALFANYTTCHLALFSDQEAILNKAIDDAGILTQQPPPQAVGMFLTMIWGMLYTVLQTDPATAVLANLVQIAFNIAPSLNKTGVVASNAFQVEVSDLWHLLSEGFDELLAATAAVEIEILGDWGMLQATFAEIISNGRGNLAWPAAMTAATVATSAIPFQTAMLQALIPAKYQLYFTAGSPFPAAPGCSWLSPANHWYQIATPNSDLTGPTYMMTNDITGAGVSPAMFYQGRGGWVTPTASRTTDYNSSDDLMLVVANATSRYIQFTLTQEGWNAYTSETIPPFESGRTTWPCGSLNGSASITISYIGENVTTAATFSIYQEQGAHGTHVPEVSAVQVTKGFGLTQAQCNGGDSDFSYSASCQVTLFTALTTG